MKIFIVANFDKPNAADCTATVCEYLHHAGVQLMMQEEACSAFFRSYIEYGTFYSQLEICDVFLVIGGDGTILHAAKHAMPYRKPVLGINAGRLGFLAGLEQGETALLSKLLDGDFVVEERMALETIHSHKNGANIYVALNDVVISKGAVSRMIDLQIHSDGRFVTSYRADGVVVSTPTGSTAYAMSAGGPILDPNMHSISLTPISPHSLFDRTIVFSRETELGIAIGEAQEHAVYLTVDGEETVRMEHEDTVTVRESGATARLINLSGKPFYEVLNEKFLNRAGF